MSLTRLQRLWSLKSGANQVIQADPFRRTLVTMEKLRRVVSYVAQNILNEVGKFLLRVIRQLH